MRLLQSGAGALFHRQRRHAVQDVRLHLLLVEIRHFLIHGIALTHVNVVGFFVFLINDGVVLRPFWHHENTFRVFEDAHACQKPVPLPVFLLVKLSLEHHLLGCH